MIINLDDKLDELGYYTIHIIGFMFIAICFFILTTLLSMAIDKSFPSIENVTKKNKLLLLFEIVVQISLLGFGIHIVKNIILKIPFPFDKLYNYDHDIQGSNTEMLLTITLFLFQQNLIKKIKYLINSLNVTKIEY